MSYAMDYPIAARAAVEERAAFIRRTYAHLAGAILAFVGLETALFTSGLADTILRSLFLQGNGGILVLFLLFVGAGWVAQWWAHNAASRAMQYAGLALYVVTEAIIFVPLLWLAKNVSRDPNIIPVAGILTLGIAGGLTAAVFTTRADYSYLRPILSVSGFVLLGIALVACLFPIQLGLFYSFAVVALAGGYIIYDTSNVLHHYRTDQHVGAALELFASVALLFYYILRILYQTSNRN
jgi:FtsH-binding integral membrane protein